MHRNPEGWGKVRTAGCVVLLLATMACGRETLTCLEDQAAGSAPGLAFLARGGAIIPDPETLKALNTFVTERSYGGWCHDRFRKLDIRQTGPILPVSGRSDKAIGLTTHAQIRVYYSPEVAHWLDNDRQGVIPDGAMMVKEMYGIPLRWEDDKPKIEGWAVMVRDAAASRDGWLWYLYYPPWNQPYPNPIGFESGQNGLSFCLACHASAESQGTFAFRGNLINDDVATYVELGDLDGNDTTGVRAGAHGNFAALPEPPAGPGGEIDKFKALLYLPEELPRSEPNPAFVSLFGETIDIKTAMGAEPRRLPMDAAFDHVPVPGSGEPGFITADNCAGCHDTSDLLNGTYPEMAVRSDGRKFPLWTRPFVDLSPYGEWSGSLMSVATRDPVFRAQLEWETRAYPARAAETTRFCLSCHGAMGAREHPELAGNLALTYAVPAGYDDTRDDDDTEAEFGALSRDGVSCTVCHRIAAEGLGKPETFNARFHTDPPDQLNGPYDDVQTRSMRNALGITPQHAEHISDPGLCGSCHMVETPVADDPDPERRAHEQTTYLEWRNSDFARSGDPSETCQGCHMPDVNPMAPTPTPTRARIANIEDSTFPYVPHRLNSEALDIEVREGYRRHTLTGINLFTLRYFAQFPLALGANTFYPARPFGSVRSPQGMVMSEATVLARQQTARLSVTRGDGNRYSVAVENLAGHKFPTGVGFRRAWLEVSARGADGRVLWCSGCADAAGTLLSGFGGEPLPIERPARSNRFEPDHSVIADQSQVQIYETRHRNRAGRLTTSFLELDEEVKDNRLLPRGWDAAGFPDFQLNPVPVPEGPLSHIDRVDYDLGGVPAEASVCVRLYYQALPPYYLIDRAEPLATSAPGEAPESHRLVYLTTRLNEGKEEQGSAVATIEGWKLRIAQAGDCSTGAPL